MKEAIVTHSKYKSGSAWENCLTYSPKTTGSGTYTYYHSGKSMWTMDDSRDLFDNFEEDIKRLEYFELLDKYPVYKKYSDDCQKLSMRDFGFISLK